MVNLFSKIFGKKKPASDKDALAEQHKEKNYKLKKSPRKRTGKGSEAGASTTSSATTELAANSKTLPSVLSPNNSSFNASPEIVSSPLSKKGTTSTSILQNNGGTGNEFAPSTASTSKTSERDSPPSSGIEDNDPLRTPFSSKTAKKQGANVSSGNDVLSPRAGAPSPSSRAKAGPVDLDEDNSVDGEEENMMRLPVFAMDGVGPVPTPPHLLLNKQAEDHPQDDNSSFNISTDNEDPDYENLKRGVVPPSLLDQSVASTYKSECETSIFPLLVDEESQAGGDDKVFAAAWDPSSPIHEFPATTPTSNSGSSANVAGFSASTGQIPGFATPSSSSTNSKSFFKNNSRPSRNHSVPSASAPEALGPFKQDAFADFADFANFDSQWPPDNRDKAGKGGRAADFGKHGTPPLASPSKQKSHIYIETSRLGSSSRAEQSSSGAASLSTRETSLTELLAQAKSKSGASRKSVGSACSAPLTSSYKLRDGSSGNHGSRSTADGGGSALVTDIIQNLNAANQSREIGSITTAKEILRQRRHQKEPDESDEAAESWLFDEVTGALGPRGIAADLESLSGRSQKSGGERSHKSHRSKSRRRNRKSGSGESIGSKDSKRSSASRRSRSSRYSHRSTKSYISQMSEQSRSVANDLLRLEMQLAMVGQSQNQSDGPGTIGDTGNSNAGSDSGTRTIRSKASTSAPRRSTTSSTRRSRITVMAPPGKLGIILANKADSKGTVVSGVRTSSVLAEKISPGDRIVAIDGEDVSLMTVSEITTIMARKAEFERTLTVLTTPRNVAQADGSHTSSKYRS